MGVESHRPLSQRKSVELSRPPIETHAKPDDDEDKKDDGIPDVDDDEDNENIPPVRDESGQTEEHVWIDGGLDDQWQEQERRRIEHEQAEHEAAERKKTPRNQDGAIDVDFTI